MEVQKKLADKVGEELFMYSITLDADHDKPEILKEYRESYGVGPGWTFLTGDYDDIEHLRRRLGVFDPDPIVDADKTSHSGILFFLNEPKGRACGIPGEARPTFIARQVVRAMTM